jgi:hypothetical protein
MSSRNRESLLSEADDGGGGITLTCIFYGLRLLGFKSIDNIFLSKILFSFCISMNFGISYLFLLLVPWTRCVNCLGAFVFNIDFMLLNLVM